MTPRTEAADREPNLEMVRRLGWHIKAAYGRYCVVWRGPHDEFLLVWDGAKWERVGGGELRDAA